jgi:hypothetical protein
MATTRETQIAAEMLADAQSDGVELTPELFAYINSEARSQAAHERETQRMEEERRAVLQYGYPVHRCTKCDGAKVLPHYAGIAGGRCFSCQGKGWIKG